MVIVTVPQYLLSDYRPCTDNYSIDPIQYYGSTMMLLSMLVECSHVNQTYQKRGLVYEAM